jgi:hypothetical protein
MIPYVLQCSACDHKTQNPFCEGDRCPLCSSGTLRDLAPQMERETDLDFINDQFDELDDEDEPTDEYDPGYEDEDGCCPDTPDVEEWEDIGNVAGDFGWDDGDIREGPIHRG